MAKFNKEAYEDCDNRAKEVWRKYLDSRGIFTKVFEDYGADIQALHPYFHEVEIKSSWEDVWPEEWKTLHIPARKKKLLDEGYDVRLHVKNLIEGKFEIDLFLPELKLIIEIDGPQHFIPIFGEKRLEEVIKFDSIKNGLLISKGYCLIRIRYLCRHISQSVQRKLWALVSKQVEKIEDKFPSKNNRFIELEID